MPPPHPHPQSRRPARGCSVLLAGLGNIGSQVVEHLGRMPFLSRVVLLDYDVYEPRNFHSQNITRQDVGRPKVEVQAGRLRQLNPQLMVESVHDDLRYVPLGFFRVDLVLAGLDSVEARLHLNTAVGRAGRPWLDAGVEPQLNLVRINGYHPGVDQPCFECALDDLDYERHLKPRHACAGGNSEPVATGGSSGLGALAASLLALGCGEFFSGLGSSPLFGHQVVFDPVHHRHYLSDCRRNPACRHDHETWQWRPLAGTGPRSTLGVILDRAREAAGFADGASWRVDGQPFARRWQCVGCGFARDDFRLVGRLSAAERRCPNCADREMMAVGFEMLEAIHQGLPEVILARPATEAGLRDADVITVEAGGNRVHFEIELGAL